MHTVVIAYEALHLPFSAVGGNESFFTLKYKATRNLILKITDVIVK